VYKRGSFDLRKLEILDKGANVELRVTLSASIEDPWNSKGWPDKGNGFSLQMVQVYVDLDHQDGSGFTATLPGINAGFAAADAWDKVIIISPQPLSRLKSEVSTKAGKLAKGVVIPTSTKVRGKTLIAIVRKKDLGGDPAKAWGVQAVSQSNEGYPKGQDLLSRKVNEFPGDHRFGGGSDWECDPHVLDILVAPAKGGDDEKGAQKKALEYKCGSGGEALKPAVLPMVRLG
jgi:carbohydrate-binding DOMON domain-containing protein